MNAQLAINAGLFVQFVASNWNAGGNITDLRKRSVVDPFGNPVVAGKNYVVQETLYASDLATDFLPAGRGWITIGILAVNDADPNDVVIALRGTLTIWEWLQDAKFFARPFSSVPGSGLTEDGFTVMYDSMWTRPARGDGTFISSLLSFIPAKACVLIAGHSLGAVLATLLALDMSYHSACAVTLYTLASPRVGDLTFSRLFEHTVPSAYRVVNRLDIVPKVPPPLFYFHVGDESELLPGLDLRFNLGCEHHLTTYFHLLATTLGTPDKFPLQADCLRDPGPVTYVSPSEL